jgi:hypothetical protein
VQGSGAGDRVPVVSGLSSRASGLLHNMMRAMKSFASIAFLLVIACPGLVFAQGGSTVDEPIGRFAIDLQASLARVPQDAASAAALAVSTGELPSQALGGRVAATWYPLRLGPMTLGLGGALAVAGASRAPVETRFLSAAPQLSFNFGHRRGWSYISGGIGPSRLTTALKGSSGGPGARTIDYGAGARWFARDRHAFSFDLRFYAISATVGGGFPARGHATMLVVSAGISVK